MSWLITLRLWWHRRRQKSAKVFLVSSREKNTMTITIEGELFKHNAVEIVMVTGREVVTQKIIVGDELVATYKKPVDS